ncbi:MAG: hypothetical protein JRG73_15265 [Deltaproteobacteria bacterium]|nr:hypothetical protein [Deltaproteobacteria bacterium]
MKYCPGCSAEYFDSVEQCADCGIDLVTEEEHQLMKRREQEVLQEEAEFESIRVLENSFEADVVSESLRREDIDFIITRHEETAYDGIFIPQKGWGVVGVHPRDVDRAKSIIDAVIS